MDIKNSKTLLHPETVDFAEIEALASLVDDSRIIGVGEGAHFVSEFSLVRASLIRYLVEIHNFNSIGLECGAIQASRLSKWLNSEAQAGELEQFSDLLTYSIYGSLLTWLKSYIKDSGKQIKLIGIDLPNTLNPKEDLEQLSRTIQIIDPPMKPQVDRLSQILAPIDGQSAYASSVKWGELEPAMQDRAISEIMRLKHRLTSISPLLKENYDQNLFVKATDQVLSIEYTLETLRIMKSLFEGCSVEGDSSVRDFYMASVVERIVRENPDAKMIVLAHNNHIQKIPVSFAGEFTAVPMGQHLSDRKDYIAIALTHTGDTVPEMNFPAPSSPLGFSVENVPAEIIQEDSIEKLIISNCKNGDSCLTLTDYAMEAKRIRSQSASTVGSVKQAFDAIICTPTATKDSLFVPF